MLSATTRLCGLVGAPVSHSFSPAMHNAAFAYLGLDFAYTALPVAAPDLPDAIRGARALGFVGLNVTAPHKEAALACCVPDEVASAVGAVNTIVFDADATRGTNTDVHGIEQSLDAFVGRTLERAVVVGAGGAARAVLYALDRRGIEVSLLGRRARSLRVGARVHESLLLGDPQTRQLFANADLVVDATPLGLGDDAPAWSVAALPQRAVVLDLVVRRATPLTRAAHARGLLAQAGDTMLLHQGALAFQRFTGRAAPTDVMRVALERALDERSSS